MGKIQKFELLSNNIITEDCGENKEHHRDYDNHQLINTQYGKRIIFERGVDDPLDTNTRFNSVIQEGKGTILFKARMSSLATTAETRTVIQGGYANPNMVVAFKSANRLYVNASTVSGYIAQSTVVVPDTNLLNVWHSYCVRYDGVNLELWQDGNKFHTTPLAIIHCDPSKTLRDTVHIGGVGNTLAIWRVFEGLLSDVILDTNVWSDEDIVAYHNNDLFDTGIHVSSCLELDNTTTILDKGYKGATGTFAEDNKVVVVDTPVGAGLEWVANQARILMDDPVIPQGDFTISFWMAQTYIQTASRAIMSNRDSTSTGFTINAASNNLSFRIRHYVGTNETFIKGFGDFDEELKHVVITLRVFEGDSYINTYINGDVSGDELVKVGFINDIPPTRNLEIFNSAEAGIYNPKGLIAKIKIFDKALTPVQVKDLNYKDMNDQIHYDVIKDPTE